MYLLFENLYDPNKDLVKQETSLVDGAKRSYNWTETNN